MSGPRRVGVGVIITKDDVLPLYEFAVCGVIAGFRACITRMAHDVAADRPNSRDRRVGVGATALHRCSPRQLALNNSLASSPFDIRRNAG